MMHASHTGDLLSLICHACIYDVTRESLTVDQEDLPQHSALCIAMYQHDGDVRICIYIHTHTSI